jgi:hypothetical protein
MAFILGPHLETLDGGGRDDGRRWWDTDDGRQTQLWWWAARSAQQHSAGQGFTSSTGLFRFYSFHRSLRPSVVPAVILFLRLYSTAHLLYKSPLCSHSGHETSDLLHNWWRELETAFPSSNDFLPLRITHPYRRISDRKVSTT